MASNDPVLRKQAERLAPKLARLVLSEMLDEDEAKLKKMTKGPTPPFWIDLAEMCLRQGWAEWLRIVDSVPRPKKE